MRREAERTTSFTLIRVCKRVMMGSDFSLLFFFKAGVKQGLFFFPAAHGLFLVAVSGGYSPLRCTGFSCGGFSSCGAQALGTWASVVAALGLGTCGAWA